MDDEALKLERGRGSRANSGDKRRFEAKRQGERGGPDLSRGRTDPLRGALDPSLRGGHRPAARGDRSVARGGPMSLRGIGAQVASRHFPNSGRPWRTSHRRVCRAGSLVRRPRSDPVASALCCRESLAGRSAEWAACSRPSDRAEHKCTARRDRTSSPGSRSHRPTPRRVRNLPALTEGLIM